MKLVDSLWLRVRSGRFSREIVVVAAVLALAGCAEGVPPFGLAGDSASPAGSGGAAGMSGMGPGGTGGSSGMSGTGGRSGSGGSSGTGGRSGSGGSAGSGGSGGTGGSGGAGGEVVPCDLNACPDPPAPFPFVPAPAACCKDNGQCGAVDLFGGCA